MRGGPRTTQQSLRKTLKPLFCGQSYILEGALADVQERTARFLEMLSGGSLGLLLRPTKVTKSSKVTVEAIDKVAVVRLSNGVLENRSLRQLSGGERRRMASFL